MEQTSSKRSNGNTVFYGSSFILVVSLLLGWWLSGKFTGAEAGWVFVGNPILGMMLVSLPIIVIISAIYVVISRPSSEYGISVNVFKIIQSLVPIFFISFFIPRLGTGLIISQQMSILITVGIIFITLIIFYKIWKR